MVMMYELRKTDFNYIALLFVLGFCLLGLLLIGVGLIGSRDRVIKWAERTGNHEITIPFILLSYGVASLIEFLKKVSAR